MPRSVRSELYPCAVWKTNYRGLRNHKLRRRNRNTDLGRAYPAVGLRKLLLQHFAHKFHFVIVGAVLAIWSGARGTRGTDAEGFRHQGVCRVRRRLSSDAQGRSYLLHLLLLTHAHLTHLWSITLLDNTPFTAHTCTVVSPYHFSLLSHLWIITLSSPSPSPVHILKDTHHTV